MAIQGQQLLGAADAEIVGRRIIALHLLLDRLIELAVPRRAAREEHPRYVDLILRDATRVPREILHLARASDAAMVGEYGPVASAQLPLEASQIHGGGRDGALGRQTVVANDRHVRRPARDRLVSGGAARGSRGNLLARDLVAGDD